MGRNNGSKITLVHAPASYVCQPTQGREWAVYSSQHGMESPDIADAGQCKDQLSSTSQAQVGGTGGVGQVGPFALFHDLLLLAGQQWNADVVIRSI